MRDYYYMVIIPQGVGFYETQEDLDKDNWYNWAYYIRCTSQKEAEKVAAECNAAYYEKVEMIKERQVRTWFNIMDKSFFGMKDCDIREHYENNVSPTKIIKPEFL